MYVQSVAQSWCQPCTATGPVEGSGCGAVRRRSRQAPRGQSERSAVLLGLGNGRTAVVKCAGTLALAVGGVAQSIGAGARLTARMLTQGRGQDGRGAVGSSNGQGL
jgi:hypothetical protein